MTVIRVTTGLLAGLMLGSIIVGFASADFGDEGRQILDLAWGRVTLVDLYAGLVLFGGWVWLRERTAAAFPWIVGLVFLGNLAAALYAFVAAVRSETVRDLLLGDTR